MNAGAEGRIIGRNLWESTYVKENPYKEKMVRAGFAAVNFIVKEKIDALITREIGGISFHTLRDHLVDIYKIKGKNVREAVDNFVNNKLEHLTKPTKEEPPPVESKPPERRPRGYGRRWGRDRRYRR